MTVVLAFASGTALSCSGDDGHSQSRDPAETAGAMRTGTFLGPRVGGLTYVSGEKSGITTKDGHFDYAPGETVTFSIGDFTLGSVEGRESVTPKDLAPGVHDDGDSRLTNLLVLLQTLDENGDLNDGIEITPEIAQTVSQYKSRLEISQPSPMFAASEGVVGLLDQLNQESRFSDTDPRPRRLRTAEEAEAYFVRATAERTSVETTAGTLVGFAATPTTWQWLGVPYGKPPLGALRWRPPEPREAWSGERDAIAWSDQAAQDPALESTGQGGMSEDCLYLNVTAPRDAKTLPVMVWFHGGAFAILTANSTSYNNPSGLTNKGVVLVTVNHRLGAFGYLSHPLLTAESGYGGSGNYGQMDLVLALKWVKDNIAKFGGDPESVTVFGQSGGCGKITSLMFSNAAKGLFHRAACQSGTSPIDANATVEGVVADGEKLGRDMFSRLGVSSLQEARALPWTRLVQSDVDAAIPRTVYRPTIDNNYMSITYQQALTMGLPSDVPLMVGGTSGDYASLINGLRAAVPVRRQGTRANMYVYKFSRVPTGWAELGLLAGHGGELPYLFGDPEMFVSNYTLGLVLDPKTGQKPPIADLNGDGRTGTDGDRADLVASMRWGADDARTADSLMTAWTNFAKVGDPSMPGLTWTPYTLANDALVDFGQTTNDLKTGLAASFPPQ